MDSVSSRLHFSYAGIGAALRDGRAMFGGFATASIACACVFTLFGLFVLVAIGALGFSPLQLGSHGAQCCSARRFLLHRMGAMGLAIRLPGSNPVKGRSIFLHVETGESTHT